MEEAIQQPVAKPKARRLFSFGSCYVAIQGHSYARVNIGLGDEDDNRSALKETFSELYEEVQKRKNED